MSKISTTKPVSKVNYKGIDLPLHLIDGKQGKYVARVVDYDGTILKEQYLDTNMSFYLPSAPVHENLNFIGWSSPVDISDNHVKITDSDIVIGPVYTTNSGLNEFDIELNKVTGLSVNLNLDDIKDWGDGASDSLTTHTYANYGVYTIKCAGKIMTTSSISGLFSQSSTSANYYVTSIRLANIETIKSYSFNYLKSLTSLSLSDTITTIESNAFRESPRLNSIIFPTSLTIIPELVCDGCHGLSNVVIPNTISAINSSAFSNCEVIENITLPSNLESLGLNVFNSCYSLKRITIPTSMTSLGDGIFSSCYTLEEVKINNGITMLTSFNGCKNLRSIDIPENVTNIGSFNGCENLKVIKIPGKVTNIGINAFSGCYSMEEYDFSEFDTPPILDNINAFRDINGLSKIWVKDANALEAFKIAENWSTYADYMYIKE